MVLSMSTRLAWRWQSLIMSTEFVKQKEQGRAEKGEMERLQVKRRKKSREIERLERQVGRKRISRSQTRYCFVKVLSSDQNVNLR